VASEPFDCQRSTERGPWMSLIDQGPAGSVHAVWSVWVGRAAAAPGWAARLRGSEEVSLSAPRRTIFRAHRGKSTCSLF